MHPALHFADHALTFRFLDGRSETRRVPPEKNPFNDWIEAYRLALQQTRHADTLLNLGRAIHAWLNEGGGYLDRLLKPASGNLRCMVFSVDGRPDPDALRFLEVPWELLADANGHLAADVYAPFCPVRRIGEPGTPDSGSEYRLNAVFMAAAPRAGGPTLDYEAEESAILNATGKVGMDLVVEESGAMPDLADRISRERPVDVLHLSCHGTNEPELSLSLEDSEGRHTPTSPGELSAALGQHRPRMLFLSACQTSEPNRLLNSFSSEMIRFGIPAVLGWGGSVQDTEATAFAAALYQSLARKNSLEYALATARSHLLNPPDRGLEKQGPAQDWHLARLYLGPDGGGVLCGGEKARRRGGRTRAHREFLDVQNRQVPVASRDEFVGRRRNIQTILREFRKADHAGVMIRGFGRQGKSSLAARVANRMADHRTVVVYGKFDAAAVLNGFAAAFRGVGPVREIVARHLSSFKKEGGSESGILAGALTELLEGPCSDLASGKQPGGFLERLRRFAPFSGKPGNSDPHQPMLLAIDDFEQMLIKPDGGGLHTVDPDRLAVVRAVIEAFDACRDRTLSRLMFTCRYRFTLPSERGDDLYDRLYDLQLPAMEPVDSRKQANAKARISGAPETVVYSDRIRRCIRLSRGNPGLQDLLFSLVLESAEACDRALNAMETYLKTGEMPEEEETTLRFLNNLAVVELLSLLRNTERELLRASTLFEMPVPMAVMEKLADSAGLKEDDATGERLVALGLWELFEGPVNPDGIAVAVNGLVRPRAGRLNEEETRLLAGAVVDALFEACGGEDGKNRPYVADYELFRLSVKAICPEGVKAVGKDGLAWLRDNFLYLEAAQIGRQAVKLLDDAKIEIHPNMLRLAGEMCGLVGDVETEKIFIGRAVKIFREAVKKGKQIDITFAYALGNLAEIYLREGEVNGALNLYKEECEIFELMGYQREKALASGSIARIVSSKGEVDKSLKIHEENLEILESLGDYRELAITMGEKAKILLVKGEINQAFYLFQEVIKICEKIGDKKGKAVTLGDIARIQYLRGEVDEALKNNIEGLSIFESIGDLGCQANSTVEIAKIRFLKGEVDEAIQLHNNALQIFESLRKINEKAISLGYIARILFSKGDTIGALKNHKKALRIYEKIGDLRSQAIALVDIARIHSFKNEINETLTFCYRALDRCENLGDKRGKAVILGEIARIRIQDDIDEALKLHEEELNIFESIGDKRAWAVALSDIARICMLKGEVDKAYQLYEEMLRVFDIIGDICSKAITLWGLAQIDLKKKKNKKVFERLSESYTILLKIDKLDGISFVGKDFGLLLCQSGNMDEGIPILRRSQEAFTRLGKIQNATEVAQLIEAFEKTQ